MFVGVPAAGGVTAEQLQQLTGLHTAVEDHGVLAVGRVDAVGGFGGPSGSDLRRFLTAQRHPQHQLALTLQ